MRIGMTAEAGFKLVPEGSLTSNSAAGGIGIRIFMPFICAMFMVGEAGCTSFANLVAHSNAHRAALIFCEKQIRSACANGARKMLTVAAASAEARLLTSNLRA